jgi:hypothetical protein
MRRNGKVDDSNEINELFRCTLLMPTGEYDGDFDFIVHEFDPFLP